VRNATCQEKYLKQQKLKDSGRGKEREGDGGEPRTRVEELYRNGIERKSKKMGEDRRLNENATEPSFYQKTNRKHDPRKEKSEKVRLSAGKDQNGVVYYNKGKSKGRNHEIREQARERDMDLRGLNGSGSGEDKRRNPQQSSATVRGSDASGKREKEMEKKQVRSGPQPPGKRTAIKGPKSKGWRGKKRGEKTDWRKPGRLNCLGRKGISGGGKSATVGKA